MFFWNCLAFSMIQQILAIWSLVPLPFEEIQRMGSWNQFLKISNYPKTCSTSFPGAQSASLSTLNFLRGCWRSTAAAAQGSISAEADGKCPCCSVTQCPTLCDPMDCSTPGFPVLYHLPELGQTHVHWVGDAIQPSLSSPSLPVFNFPSIKVFSNESALCIRWANYWSFNFSISPSKEYSGQVSLQLTGLFSLQSKGLKSLLQHHSSKATILWCSVFLTVQLSHHTWYWKNYSFD